METVKVTLITIGDRSEIFIQAGTTVAEAFRYAGLEVNWQNSTAQNEETGVNMLASTPITKDGLTIKVSKVTTGN
jgi:hypothetical protein